MAFKTTHNKDESLPQFMKSPQLIFSHNLINLICSHKKPLNPPTVRNENVTFGQTSWVLGTVAIYQRLVVAGGGFFSYWIWARGQRLVEWD